MLKYFLGSGILFSSHYFALNTKMTDILLMLKHAFKTHLAARDIHTQFPSFEALVAPIPFSMNAMNVACLRHRTVLSALVQVV